MKKITIFCFFLILLPVSGAMAEIGRFEFRKTTDGFIRLDRKTGAVDYCSQVNRVWQCKAMATEKALQLKTIQNRQAEKPGIDSLAFNKIAAGFRLMANRFARFIRQVSTDLSIFAAAITA